VLNFEIEIKFIYCVPTASISRRYRVFSNVGVTRLKKVCYDNLKSYGVQDVGSVSKSFNPRYYGVPISIKNMHEFSVKDRYSYYSTLIKKNLLIGIYSVKSLNNTTGCRYFLVFSKLLKLLNKRISMADFEWLYETTSIQLTSSKNFGWTKYVGDISYKSLYTDTCSEELRRFFFILKSSQEKILDIFYDKRSYYTPFPKNKINLNKKYYWFTYVPKKNMRPLCLPLIKKDFDWLRDKVKVPVWNARHSTWYDKEGTWLRHHRRSAAIVGLDEDFDYNSYYRQNYFHILKRSGFKKKKKIVKKFVKKKQSFQKITAVQCQALTFRLKQCQNKTRVGSFCYLHSDKTPFVI